MSNELRMVKVVSGKVVVKENETIIREKSLIIPKNVVDMDYFQVACQYHALSFIEDKFLGEEEEMLFYNSEEDIYNDDDLLEEYEYILLCRKMFRSQMMTLSDNINAVDGLLFEIANDMFARRFVACHLNIIGQKKVVEDDKGNESIKVIPYDFMNSYPTAVIDLRTLLKWFEDGKKASEKNNVFNLFRDTCNKLFATNGGRYKKINFNKLGENLLVNHYLTACKNDMKSGKNGGFTNDFKSCQKLLKNLTAVAFISLGCSEPEKVVAKSGQALAIDAIARMKPIEPEKPTEEN